VALGLLLQRRREPSEPPVVALAAGLAVYS
jgi:hypothetical protein